MKSHTAQRLVDDPAHSDKEQKHLQKITVQPPSEPPQKKRLERVPELPKLGPDEPVDPVRFHDSLEVDKLP